MIHQLDIYGKDKVDLAIETLRFFEPKDGRGYYLAFSGGKDSVCLKALADMAGVKYDAHYSVSSVDPPELVRFIKQYHPDVAFEHSFDKDGKPYSMWNLIPQKGMPPTRLARYCCQYLKESQGDGRITLTGVRWAESTNRQANQGRVTIADKKVGAYGENFTKTPKGGVVLKEDRARVFLNNDNAESREVVDFCTKQRKTVVNPIIDWTDNDVWEVIEEQKIPYCQLYDEGYKRLGCIGCPMGGGQKMREEFERFPKYKKLYLIAFDKMLKKKPSQNWKTAEDVFNWWVGDAKAPNKSV